MPTSSDTFCALEAVASNESLVGTAIESVRFLVCLEFQRAWPAKILKEPELPGAVVATLKALDHRDDTRVQYLRRPDREPGSVVLLVADMARAEVRRWNLGDHQDVQRLDWDALDRGELPPGGNPVSEPVVLVCTHGKRDACCAKWGVAFWRALLGCEKGASVRMWQTSHLGGHRFAATALVLPHGYQYGRLESEEAADFLAAVDVGKVYRPERLRGRTVWSRAAQAAEIYSRQGRELGPEDVSVVSVDALELGPGQEAWRVRLDVLGQPESWDIARHVSSERLRPPSCGKAPEPVSELLLLA